MGYFNGTEVDHLVDTYTLKQPKNTLKHHLVGLYRDNGFSLVKALAGPEIERIKNCH